MEPAGVGAGPVDGEGGDLDLVLLAPHQPGDGEESPAAVRGDGLGPVPAGHSLAGLPPLEFVSCQDAILGLLGRRHPPHDDGGGGGGLHRHVLRGVGRDVTVGPAGDLLTVRALSILIVS